MKALTALTSETMVTILLEKSKMRVTMLSPRTMLRPMKVSKDHVQLYDMKLKFS